MKKSALISFLMLALAVPAPSQHNGSPTRQNARDYYTELHDSGDAWNKGHRFNRVCFGDEHPRGEIPDMFVATKTFTLIGFWEASPEIIEVQQYTEGEAGTIQKLARDLDGLGWTHMGELGGRRLRTRFTLSAAGRYHYSFDYPDYPESSIEVGMPSGGGVWSRGKCEVIR
jgi:hypothetical protein